MVEAETLAKKKKRTGRIIRTILIILAVLFVVYWIFIYFLVSMALIPSFMQKMESFDRITKKSYAEQVQSDEIQDNRRDALEETREWLEVVPHEKREVISDDGYRLIAEEFLREDTGEDSHDWVILLHGYTGVKEEMYPFAYEYYQRGYHVLVPDLRCQGESEGDFIGMGYTDSQDLCHWIDLVKAEDPDAQIVLHGQSMGAATALIYSGRPDAEQHVRSIISDSSYTDAYTMFGEKAYDWFHLPAFPLVDSMRLMLLLRGGYDLYDASAINAIQTSSTPTLLIHGDKDRMISAEQSVELYEAASCPKKLFLVEGAGHGQPQDKDPEGYYKEVFGWISGK